jgi:hypothetical protein
MFKNVIGRIFESFGIAVAAGGVMNYTLTSIIYWYWLLAGSVVLCIGVGLQYWKEK